MISLRKRKYLVVKEKEWDDFQYRINGREKSDLKMGKLRLQCE